MLDCHLYDVSSSDCSEAVYFEADDFMSLGEDLIVPQAGNETTMFGSLNTNFHPNRSIRVRTRFVAPDGLQEGNPFSP